MSKNNIKLKILKKFKNKIALLLSLFLLVLLAIFYFIFFQPSKTHTITLTENGFVPANLLIRVDDSVEFTNGLDRPFWPASASHPSHLVYPEFDAMEPIYPGNTWVFLFDKEGAWDYHDHLSSIYEGTIIVGNKNKEGDNCDDDRTSKECIVLTLKEKIKSEGVDEAFDYFEALYNSNGNFASYCHDIAHQIGRFTYGYYDKDQIRYTDKLSYCGFGFYHGFMEKLIAENQNLEEAHNFCQRLSTVNSAASLENGCFHGLGHAALVINVSRNVGNEQGMIDGAVDFCNEVGVEREYINSCYGGAFMELSFYYSENEYKLSYDKNDPLSICKKQSEDVKALCYEQMYRLISFTTGGDLYKAIEYLYELGNDSELYFPVQNLVGSMTKENNRIQNLMICRQIRTGLKKPCIEGIVLSILLYGTPNRVKEEALKFCNSDTLFQEEKTTCINSSRKLKDS